jgi:hypothetical protein
MDKEAAIRAFVISLKVAFRNASIYSLEHPAFASGIEDLQKKIEDLFEFIIPLNIGFSPHSLFIDGYFYEKEKIYQELAKLFHFRKIKSMEIDQSVSQAELIKFIAKVSEPTRDIFAQGGPIAILEKEQIQSITVEELDYRELLKGEGKELKEIWVRLLQDALETQNQEQIMELANSFPKVIKEFSIQEIIDSRETKDTLKQFFTFLHANEDKKFVECSKEFVKSTMRNKDNAPQEAFREIRQMTKGIMEEDLALTFWEEILTDESFEPLNLNIFSKFVEGRKEDKVNYHIQKMFRTNETINSNLQLMDKLKELFSGPESELISGIYRKTLNTLLKNLSWETDKSFDHQQIFRNSRFIFSNLFESESSPDDAVILLKQILDQWDRILQERDFEFLKVLYDALTVRNHDMASDPVYKQIKHQIAEFVERSILEGNLSLYLEHFINQFEKSVFEVNMYLDNIFTEAKITPYILKAYFKFHTEYLFYFNLNLDTYASDINLMERIITSLQMIDSRVSFVTLKTLFKHKNPRIKRRVLQALQDITLYEIEFLLPIIRGKDLVLKAEALVILSKDETMIKKALSRMFLIQSPFGIRNRWILDHIFLVERKNLREAIPYLKALSQRKAFWNRKVRGASQQTLEKWNAG